VFVLPEAVSAVRSGDRRGSGLFAALSGSLSPEAASDREHTDLQRKWQMPPEKGQAIPDTHDPQKLRRVLMSRMLRHNAGAVYADN
jgi:hypothetical protein